MAQKLKSDRTLFMTVLVMVLFGFIMVYSASSVVAEVKKGSSYYYALRQLLWIVVAMPLMIFFKNLHYRKLQTPAVAFTLIGLVFIMLIAAYFMDPVPRNGGPSACGTGETCGGIVFGVFHCVAVAGD